MPNTKKSQIGFLFFTVVLIQGLKNPTASKKRPQMKQEKSIPRKLFVITVYLLLYHTPKSPPKTYLIFREKKHV